MTELVWLGSQLFAAAADKNFGLELQPARAGTRTRDLYLLVNTIDYYSAVVEDVETTDVEIVEVKNDAEKIEHSGE